MSMERNSSSASTSSTLSFKKLGSAFRRIGSRSGREAPIDNGLSSSKQKFVQELDAVETVPHFLSPPDKQHITNGAEAGRVLSLKVRILETSLDNSIEVAFAAKLYAQEREEIRRLCQAVGHGIYTLQDDGSFHFVAKSSSTASVGKQEQIQDVYASLCRYLALIEKRLQNSCSQLDGSSFVRQPSVPGTTRPALYYSHRQEIISFVNHTQNERLISNLSDMTHLCFDLLDLVRDDLFHLSSSLSAVKCESHWDPVIAEHKVAPRWDTILECHICGDEKRGVIRWWVSSSILKATSTTFLSMLAEGTERNQSDDHLTHGPSQQLCLDGATAKTYEIQHVQVHNLDAFSTLLYAAHHRNEKIPKAVTYEELVSIVEICLQYHCTAPLEMAMEFRWLPQWLHKANDDLPLDFVIISYCFGMRRLFTRTSKSVILDLIDELDINKQTAWPETLKQKILAVRTAKLQQVYAACVRAVEEHLRPSTKHLYRTSRPGPIELTTVPICPRGSRQCDATNLGWLLMIFNELEILPYILQIVDGRNAESPPARSIKDLIFILRSMRGVPSVQGTMCDHATALRTTMNDIYNSISGLTLWDVSGVSGWALSKYVEDSLVMRNAEGGQVFELPATVSRLPESSIFKDQSICLRILAHLDTLDDLQSTALSCRNLYHVYKKHEIILLKAILRSRRMNNTMITKNTAADVDGEVSRIDSHPQTPLSAGHNYTPLPVRPVNTSSGHESRVEDNQDVYGVSPPASPALSIVAETVSSMDDGERLKHVCAQDRWAESTIGQNRRFQLSLDLDPDYNMKFLPDARAQLEKSLVVEGKKHLRDESDHNLRHGRRGECAEL